MKNTPPISFVAGIQTALFVVLMLAIVGMLAWLTASAAQLSAQTEGPPVLDVKLGQLLFTDKTTPGVRYTAPGSGLSSSRAAGESRVMSGLPAESTWNTLLGITRAAFSDAPKMPRQL